MYEEELMNEEVMEPTNEEVITNEDNCVPAAPSVPAEIYVPQDDATSKGPNKALIAVAVAGGLFLANKARKKIAPAIERRRAKKAAEEEQKIMQVLEKAGLVQPKEVPAETVVEVATEEVKDATTEKEKIDEK